MVNRLFGICYQLMQRDKIPAKELAERYEVSVRTIYRDVEILSMAGVPLPPGFPWTFPTGAGEGRSCLIF